MRHSVQPIFLPILSCTLHLVLSGTKNLELNSYSPVGIEHTSRVSNNDFSSSSKAPSTQDYYCRLNFNNHWAPTDSDSDPYIQITFTNVWIIHQVGTQGKSLKYVQQYNLAFYVDGEWVKYTEGGTTKDFEGNTDDSTGVINDLLEPVSNFGIRFYPICCSDVEFALRVEAYGVIADLAHADIGTRHGGHIHVASFYASSGSVTNAKISQYSNAWIPSTNEGSWLAVDLGTVFRLYGYGIEGLNNGYVNKFMFEYSPYKENDTEWVCIQRGAQCANFTASKYQTTNGAFPDVIEARFIRVIPLEYDGALKLKIGYNGYKKLFRTQITAHLAYSASSNTNIQHHMNSAYFQYNHAHIAWYAASSVSAEWAQLTFSTVYDVSYIRYRGKYEHSRHYAARYFTIHFGTDSSEDDIECVKEPGQSDCKEYYHAESAVVISENQLLSNGNYIPARYIRLYQVEPVDPTYPNFAVVMSAHGYPAPESCVEAQLRYGFPASGLFWIDIDGEERDYDALQIQCDMSTIPAATLLSHNREGMWMHSKNHLLHIEHVDTLEYSLDHTMVEKIVDGSVSCELPFEAHGRGVSLRSAYWRRKEESWRSDSFRNLEDDHLFVEQESNDEPDDELMSHVANMWTMAPPLATKPGRNGHPKGSVELGVSDDFTLLEMEPWNNVTVGSFSIFAVLKLYSDTHLDNAYVIKSVHRKNPFFIVRKFGKQQLRMTFYNESSSGLKHYIAMYDVPLDTWMSLVISYDQDSSTISLMRDCHHTVSESIDPAIVYDINIKSLEFGRTSANRYPHMEISDTVMHFDMAMDDQMCEDVMSLMDDTQKLGNVENIRDCGDLVGIEGKTSGVYKIHPFRSQEGIFVYCDLDTDSGGWTKLYKRSSEKLDVDHYWDGYRRGFGSVDEDHFLGLENMHRITTSARYEFRVEATDYDNVTESIVYPHFVIMPETDDYAVNLGHGVGDLVDATNQPDSTVWMRYGRFSTRDRVGSDVRRCLDSGSYWTFAGYFHNCFAQNLFGAYVEGADGCELTGSCTQWNGLIWGSSTQRSPLRMIELKIRRFGDPESFPLLVASSIPDSAYIGDQHCDIHNCNPPDYGVLRARMMPCDIDDMTNCAFITHHNSYQTFNWIQAELGHVYVPTAIGTQCRSIAGGHWIQCWDDYEVRYSYDGRNFKCYGEDGSTCEVLNSGHIADRLHMYALQVNELDPGKISPSRFLRLLPKSEVGGYMSTTLEFYVKIPSETDMPRRCHTGLGTGPHTIYPRDQNHTVNVWCDSDWIVVMRRNQSSSGFDTAVLQEFIDGFGTDSMSGDFWLGLEAIHKLTQHMPHTMRIELVDSSGTTEQVDYGVTKVMSKENDYALRYVYVDLPSGEESADYVGCYLDEADRAMEHRVSLDEPLSLESCLEHCADTGFPYFGVQAGYACFCGTGYDKHGAVEESECNVDCAGNSNQTCGGPWRNSVYKITALKPAGDSMSLDNSGFVSGCGSFWWFSDTPDCDSSLTGAYPSHDSSSEDGFSTGINWRTFQHPDTNNDVIKEVIIKMRPSASRYAGSNLPSYAFSGMYRPDMDCHASSAYLYSDGLSGEKAWCAPTADVRDEYYLQVDLKNSYYISALMIQGLSSGYVTQFKFHMSANGINYTCYVSPGVNSDCETLTVSPTSEVDYQSLVSVIHIEPVRYVRIEPAEFVDYPKLRVDFLLEVDRTHGYTWRREWFSMYGGLIDSVRRRNHPVTEIHIGSTSNGLSTLDYRLPGPLRCYNAFKTCEEVSAAGLSSGIYWLDPDGAAGDHPPFQVECFIEGLKSMGVVYPDIKELQSTPNSRKQSLHYGEGTRQSLLRSTEHIEELMEHAVWNEQYMKYVMDGTESAFHWYYHEHGDAHARYYYPNTLYPRYCMCDDIGNCAGTSADCLTHIVGQGVQVDEGYLLPLRSDILLPVTQWYGNTHTGTATFGAVNMYFADPYKYVYRVSNNYVLLTAAAACVNNGHQLATFDQLVAAHDAGFDSECTWGWVQEGMAYSLVRPRVHTNAQLCFGMRESGVGMRTGGSNSVYQGSAFCYSGDTAVRKQIKSTEAITPTNYTVEYEDYDAGVDFCLIYTPCKSQGRCINDRLHQYICICVVESDLSRNCTDGLPTCGDFQSQHSSVSGYYYIDPDGHGTGTDSFEVYCDMTYAPPITILENNAACGGTYREISGAYNYYGQVVDVSYRHDYTDEQLESLIDSSNFCHQVIEFHSYNSGAYTSKYYYGTTSTADTSGAYWECDCNPHCAEHGKKCNTREKRAIYREDTITITDRSKLPIREFYTGDVDQYNEMTYVRVSHLQCIAHAFPTCYHYEIAGHTTPGQYKLSTGSEVECSMQGYEVPECGDDWVTGNGSCYYLQRTNYNQQGAKDNCEDMNGYLAVINSAEDMEYFEEVSYSDGYWYYIGLEYVGYGGTNLALNKPAWQKDNYSAPGYAADKAVDGIINNNNMIHSDASIGPWWWYVDLESQKDIGNVRIFNRINLEWRAGEFLILGSDTANTDPSDTSADWVVIGHHPDTMTEEIKNIPASGQARYVAIYFPLMKNGQTTYGNGYINLREIEVYEHSEFEDMYVWLDGTTENDFSDWRSGYPTSSRKGCVLWSVQASTIDWDCADSGRWSICERTHIIMSQEEVESDMTNFTSVVLDPITLWNETELMDECEAVGPCASYPCLNNGTCTANYYLETFECECTEGFLGDRCEIPKLCDFEPFPANTNVTLLTDTGELYDLFDSEDTLVNGIPANIHNYTVGSTLQYTCSEGTLIQGSSTRVCQSDLRWSGLPPVCGELSSCIDYQLRCFPSGLYELDFDGYSGPLPPVLAYCDMSTTPPTTIIHTTNSCDNKVQGHRDSKNYTMQVDYVLPDEYILALTESSVSCSQKLQYDCYKNMMWQNYAWVGRDNATQYTYFDTGTQACNCLNGRRCTYYHHGCNCDYNDYYWRQDIGYITEMDKLPIRRVYYGGQTEDLSLGFHQVGELRCQQAYLTCADYESMGQTEGYVWIDSDGLGGTPPVYVLCDYDSDIVTITHNFPWTSLYYAWGWYGSQYIEPFSWDYDYTYAPNNPEDISAFLQTAKSAQQTVTYMCLNSFLYYDGVQYGGWAGPDGVIQESFAGTPENGQGCACANDGSCQYGIGCNCANVWYIWRWLNDEATITRAELLPITSLYMGRLYYDHGSYYRSGRMFLSQLTAEVSNEPTSTVGLDCSAESEDEMICQGQCSCHSNGECINPAVNDPDTIINPLADNCTAKNPCDLSTTPCQNGGSCYWDPWTDERYYCVCDGNWGGINCDLPGAVNGGWSDWNEWGICEGICGNGTQTRNKTCDNPPAAHGGIECGGSSLESQICTLVTPCPVDGEWADWENWSACSVTCAQGVQHRNRSCSHPTPEHGGEECAGNFTQFETCSANEQCPQDGGWSNWGNWTVCSVSCDNGTTTRTRACDSPLALFNGTDCAGNDTETDDCFIVDCPIHGNWTEWSIWGDCSVTCENGTQTRNRSCTNPAPKFDGDDCPDGNVTVDVQGCHNAIMCPVNGGWSNWTDWSNCSASCNNGTIFRLRTCDSPEPAHNGTNCTGDDMEVDGCFLMDCPIHGNWTEWSIWGDCSVTCENGTQTRNRSCTNPAPKFDGDDCPDANVTVDVQGCHNAIMCPVNATWSNWTEWTNCSDYCGPDCIIPCGNGTMQRYRNCSQSLYNGYDCIGESMENITCALPTACRSK